jgi:hypothetical protein
MGDSLILLKYNISHEQLLANPQNTILLLQNTQTQLLQSHYSLKDCKYQLSEVIGWL